MEPEVLNAVITTIGSLLGAIISAWASIRVAAIKARKEAAKEKPRTWLWFVIGAIVGGLFTLFTLSIIPARERVPAVSGETVTPVSTEAEAITTAERISATPPGGEESTAPGITYGFEDGTLEGWRAWQRDVGVTIQALTVTESMSFAGQRALQVDVRGLSGYKGATIYLEGVTPTRIFSVKARLPSTAPADVDVWIQLAAAPVTGSFQESKIVYLSRNKWANIEWDTSSYGWADGSVRAIYIQLGAGEVEYTGSIYIDEIYVR